MAQPRQQRTGDVTGQQKAKLAAAHAKEQNDRASELSMMEALENEAAQNRVTDLTGEAPMILDSVQDVAAAEEELLLDPDEVALRQAPHRTIMVIDDLDQVTIGAGTSFTFKQGEKYKVANHVADYLEGKNLLWYGR